MSSVLELKNVHRIFGERYALKKIDLQVRKGEAVALCGPNGSGKTTLLRIMATLLPPTSGTIRHFGEPSDDDFLSEARKKIGVLFVEGFLYGDLTVLENLELYAKLYHIPLAQKAVATWMAKMEVETLENEYVRTLSRGERQRVALIRSLMHEPPLLLWDEPTTGLDDRGQKILNEIVTDIKKQTTLVCATHNFPAIRSWIDRTIELSKGKLR